MKTKYNITLLLIMLVLTNCRHSLQSVKTSTTINFNAWKMAINQEFSNMLSINARQLVPKNVSKQMVQMELDLIDEDLMVKNWLWVNNKNKIKKWKRVVLGYHFLEGEVNQRLTTFIFIGTSGNWGMTYDHNSEKYYEVKTAKISDILKISPGLHGAGIGLGIISEFDTNMVSIKNVLVAGVSFSEELAPLMKIYDERIFN